ncbi:hypothetical protein DICPUDRAFT_34340, partial [Dictyostelium purpureum]
HGVLKVRTSEEKARALKLKELEKIDSYNKLVKSFEEKREKENGQYDDQSLAVSKLVLVENPEYYTIWNYRRNVMNQFKEKGTSDIQQVYQNELKFIEECIQRYTKSYWIWYHRKWVTVRLDDCDWDRELKLCSKLLNLDLRNFHCWSYRRFVLENSKIPLEDEFKYTTSKIEQNFSNYSAWHQRSSILPKIYPEPEKLLEKVLEEFELVRSAVFTEPKDSSSWIYHKWLVATLKSIPNSNYIDVLKNELEQINELIEMEPNCKCNIKKILKFFFFTGPIYITLLLKIEIGGYDKNELKETIQELIKLDNDHINYYKHLETTI